MNEYSKQYNWTDEQRTEINNAVNNYKEVLEYVASDGNYYTMKIGNVADIEKYIDRGEISTKNDLEDIYVYARDSKEGSFDKLLNQIQNKNGEKLIQDYKDVDLKDANISDIEEALKESLISRNHASQIYKTSLINKINRINKLNDLNKELTYIDNNKILFTETDYQYIKKHLQEKIHSVVASTPGNPSSSPGYKPNNESGEWAIFSNWILDIIRESKRK